MKKFRFTNEFYEVINPLVCLLSEMLLYQVYQGGFPPSCEKLTPMIERYNEFMKDKTEKDLYYAVTD